MNSTFEKSAIYDKALKEYQDKIYWEILKPLHSIIEDGDEVYLLYNQTIIADIYIQLSAIYKIEREWEDTDFPVNLWCQEPGMKDIIFMWNKYKAIFLWYDNWDVPYEFKSKL